MVAESVELRVRLWHPYNAVVQGVGYRLEPVTDPSTVAAAARATPPPGALVQMYGGGGGEKQAPQLPGRTAKRRRYYEPRDGPAAAPVAGQGGAGKPAAATAAAAAAAIAYPFRGPVPAVRLRVGFSRPIVYALPPGVMGFALKPTLFVLYGLRKVMGCW
jgi:hypothetical protein